MRGEFEVRPAQFFYLLSLSPLREANLKQCAQNSRSDACLLGMWKIPMRVGQLVTVQKSEVSNWPKARLCLYNCSVHMEMTYYRMLLTSDPPCLCHTYHSRRSRTPCDMSVTIVLVSTHFLLSDLVCTKLVVHTPTAQRAWPAITNSFNLETPLSLAKFPFYWSYCQLGSITLFLFHSEVRQSGANYDEHR